jgi:hypothetical protein
MTGNDAALPEPGSAAKSPLDSGDLALASPR